MHPSSRGLRKQDSVFLIFHRNRISTTEDQSCWESDGEFVVGFLCARLIAPWLGTNARKTRHKFDGVSLKLRRFSGSQQRLKDSR